MKFLIYFLLFSPLVFSQNYQYAIEESQTELPVAIVGVNNQLEEIEYFKAYLLPITKKATLQQALDTYGAVRLEKGDYSGVDIAMKSNQRLYGHPSTTGVPSITIEKGSINVHIESLKPLKDSHLKITFSPGSATKDCTIKNLKFAEIIANNAMLDSNQFIDILGFIRIDNSISGYSRNNKIIKHTGSQGNNNMLLLKGNRSTPSYGNIAIHSNYLGSGGKTTDIDNLESFTYIGVDCETYGGVEDDLININKVDKFKAFATMGTIGYNSGYAYADIDAKDAYLISNYGITSTNSKVSLRTNVLSFDNAKSMDRLAGQVTGFYANQYFEGISRWESHNKFEYNGVDQNVVINDPAVLSNVTNSILGTQYTPWQRPYWESIPDPLGSKWKNERVGKPDNTNFIQNLINTNGVADLPEGVFYISSTLNIPADGLHGISGKGTAKTIIVGITDDFPLISVTSGKFGNISLANLTLQGGSTGLYVSNHQMMMVYQSLKYIVFRDQAYGIQISDIYGLDNCFFEHLAFINCNIGISMKAWSGEITPHNIAGSTYVDKTVFYKCQFLNCSTSLDIRSKRASNMNAWVDCKFDGGLMAANMNGDSTFFINCDFTNFTGDYTLNSNMLNIISCKFYNNSNKKSTLYSVRNYIEGSDFLDNIIISDAVEHNAVQNMIFNSTITGNAVGKASPYYSTYSLFVNSSLISNPTLNKLLVKADDAEGIVIIDAKPKPYPQFLVTQ